MSSFPNPSANCHDETVDSSTATESIHLAADLEVTDIINGGPLALPHSDHYHKETISVPFRFPLA